jgi:hypothetical protein
MDAARLAANALFFIEHYLALAVVAIVATAIGRRILGKRFPFSNEIEVVVFSCGIGLGAISFLILLIGELHLLYVPVLLGALLIALVLSRAVLLDWLRKLKDITLTRKLSPASLAAAAGIMVLAAPFAVFPLYPAKDWDATQYHLAVAKIYVKEHSMVFTPYLRYPVFPQTNQMLFTGALLTYDEQFAQQLQFLMLLTLCFAMIAFAKGYLTSRTGWWSVALLLASPLVILLGSIAYTDIALTLFCFLCTYAFWNWHRSRSDSWIIVAGVCGGLAFGSKYTGAFFPLVFFACLAATELKHRNFRTLALLALTTFLVSVPWLVRNIYFTGNPIFPFLERFFIGIFGQRQIDPEWFSGQAGASLYIGVGRSVTSLLMLPWSMAKSSSAFIPEAPLSRIVIWLLPLTIVSVFFHRRLRWLVLLALACTIFWFFGYQLVRYLVPAFPLYCLATAGSVDWLLAHRRLPGWLRSGTMTALVFVSVLAPCWYYIAQHVKWEGPLPTTAAERDRYRSDRMSSYPAYKFLNEEVGNRYRVFALDDVRMAYFADGTFMGDTFGEANYKRIRSRMTSGESLYDELKMLSTTHLLINGEVEKSVLPRDEFFERNFRLIFSGNQTRVFELSSQKIMR